MKSLCVALLGLMVVIAGCQKKETEEGPRKTGVRLRVLNPVGEQKLPTRTEQAAVAYVPNVPAPIARTEPAVVRLNLEAQRVVAEIAPQVRYELWTFNGRVPGPILRVRYGDVIELRITNKDRTGMPHNVDFHAVTGMGGGSAITTVLPGGEKIARFKMLHPGLFVYHCAVPPVMDHIANGMYGMVLVEPENGLPRVDREYSIMQSEFYTGDVNPATGITAFSHAKGLAEDPGYIVFNGRYGALMGKNALRAKAGNIVRFFVGNIGPNKISSFHTIGEVMDRVYREGDLLSMPGKSIQTTAIPAGGAAVVEFAVEVPGDYTMLDHAIFRIEKGAIGTLRVEGSPRPDIYKSVK